MISDGSALLAVAVIWGIAAVTPGPNFLVVSRAAVGGSRTVGLVAMAGTVTGTALWGLAGAFGITLLFTTAPWLYLGLKIVGGGYLIWVGLRLLISRPAPMDISAAQARPLRADLWRAYRLGLVTNIANPKTAAFVASLFAAALPPDPPPGLAIAAVGLMTAISATWYGLLAWTLGNARVRARYLRARHVVERLSGALFMGFGIHLATDR